MEAEAARIRKLYQAELLDSPSERDFDEIVRLASLISRMPISLITLLDNDRQWYKARVGLKEAYSDRSSAICNYTIQQDDVFEVEDLTLDSRFVDNPLVTNGPKIRYYAGMPLTTSDGYRLGALCVIDTKSRMKLSGDQIFALEVLARQAVNQIELRVKNKELASQRAISERLMELTGTDYHTTIDTIKNSLEGISEHLASEPFIAAEIVKLQNLLSINRHAAQNVLEWGKVSKVGNNHFTAATAVHAVAQACLDDMAASAAAKGNTIENEVHPDIQLPISEPSLRFTLRNLLHNANKYTAGGKISVRHYTSGGGVSSSLRHYLCVVDSGTGLSETDQKRYIRTGELPYNKGTNGEMGSGLGLMLVKNLLHQAGAKLHITSLEGQSSSAIIVI